MNTIEAGMPKVIKRRCGGYLAISEEGCRFNIGVIAETEEAVRQRFREALQRWERLSQEERES